MLIGVAILVVPFLMGSTGNTSLIVGMALVLNGLLGYIYVNNMKRGGLISNILWAIILLVVPFIIYFFVKKAAYSQAEIEAYN